MERGGTVCTSYQQGLNVAKLLSNSLDGWMVLHALNGVCHLE